MRLAVSSLISIAGNNSFRAFGWGDELVEAINRFLPLEKQLTTDATGQIVHELLSEHPPEVSAEILALTVNIEREPPPVCPPAESGKKRPQLAALIVCSIMVLICLVIIAVVSITSVKTGNSPDSSLVGVVLQSLIELFRALL